MSPQKKGYIAFALFVSLMFVFVNPAPAGILKKFTRIVTAPIRAVGGIKDRINALSWDLWLEQALLRYYGS